MPEGAVLVTMDVVSLYTNIPNHEALVSVAKHLRSDPFMRDIAPYLLRLIKVCLHHTNFEFNGEHFRQIGGTSMGYPAAPSQANIFLGDLEEKAYKNATKTPDGPMRFIDDGFFTDCMAWTVSRNSYNI